MKNAITTLALTFLLILVAPTALASGHEDTFWPTWPADDCNKAPDALCWNTRPSKECHHLHFLSNTVTVPYGWCLVDEPEVTQSGHDPVVSECNHMPDALCWPYYHGDGCYTLIFFGGDVTLRYGCGFP